VSTHALRRKGVFRAATAGPRVHRPPPASGVTPAGHVVRSVTAGGASARHKAGRSDLRPTATRTVEAGELPQELRRQANARHKDSGGGGTAAGTASAGKRPPQGQWRRGNCRRNCVGRQTPATRTVEAGELPQELRRQANARHKAGRSDLRPTATRTVEAGAGKCLRQGQWRRGQFRRLRGGWQPCKCVILYRKEPGKIRAASGVERHAVYVYVFVMQA
jgi:hypothetical protein